MTPEPCSPPQRRWPDYAAIWRWHFLAGLFCIPFFCWLSVTGALYIFRPDIEHWLDRPYETLSLSRPAQPPSAQVDAALAAVPGARFVRFQPPETSTGAGQVVVSAGDRLFRVYVRPDTLQPSWIGRDDHRIMELVSHLHGQLLLGNPGSILVELAASWGIVMILTGLFLWFPRGGLRAGGVLWPRLRRTGRPFWRELHAVVGFWVSLATLFLLLSGLPWASSWGNYLSWARNLWSVTAGAPDWPIGATDQPAAQRSAGTPPAAAAMPGMSAAEMAGMAPAAAQPSRIDPAPLDRLVPLAARLRVPAPVWIAAPAAPGGDWLISSQIQNRPLRVSREVDGATGRIDRSSAFGGRNVVDRVVGVVVATHEGHLFGRLNQAVLVLVALCLITVSASGVLMWWRRRPAGRLGLPPVLARPRLAVWLLLLVLALGVLLPLFGASLIAVLLLDRIALRSLPPLRRWLGAS